MPIHIIRPVIVLRYQRGTGALVGIAAGAVQTQALLVDTLCLSTAELIKPRAWLAHRRCVCQMMAKVCRLHGKVGGLTSLSGTV